MFSNSVCLFGRGKINQNSEEIGLLQATLLSTTAHVLPFAWRTEIAAIFAICDCDAHRGPQRSQRFPRQETAVLHCDLRVRWKVASDLRFWAASSEPKTPCFCGISGDLTPSMRKSLAIAIVRFWCAKMRSFSDKGKHALPRSRKKPEISNALGS